MSRSCLDDFVIQGTLGTGSFGTVYKVTRKADGQQYALKEIDLRCMSEQEQEDCIQECSVLAALDSPYIIKFYDSFLQKGKLYICMEYAAKGNLYDYIRQQAGDLPEERIWQLFIQMLLGLSYMHGRKILHRDFKTLNVFLDEQLNVRLGDLGVAKVLGEGTLHARTMIGTPYYLSPEMCEDKPYNTKSDVWALGVGLYECCARKHPFDAENQGSLILKILRGKYPPLTGYSKELTDIVKSCLTLDASKRPGTKSLLALKSVREHAQALGIELPPLPPSKPPTPSPPPGRSPSRPSLSAAKSFHSRRARDSDSEAAAAAGVPSRSPTPPRGMQRSPSARLPAAVARVDIAADLPLGPSAPPAAAAAAGGGGAAFRPQSGGRRRSSTDAAAAGALQGSVEKQLQGVKLSSAARWQSGDSIAAASSREPPEASAANSSSAAAAVCRQEPGPSSRDVTPPPTERSHRMQQSLPRVKTKLIELVGPLAYDALHSMVLAHAGALDLLPGSSSSSSSQVSLLEQQPSLLAAVQRVVPASQAPAVLPLLVKLLYLETQVNDEDAAGVQQQDWVI